jgi:hypothetical protein
MHKFKLRSRLAQAASIGVAAASVSLILGTGVASAAPADPPGGATPVAPQFYNGNVEQIRGTGSDTTFFMMQKVSDLFTGAGLYGCGLNTSAGQTLYNSSDPASATGNLSDFCLSGQNVSTTDTSDNWDRTEVAQGVDNVGSGAGQNQLCGAANSPLNVDFARSSKPASVCPDEVQTGYAKDGIPIIDYPINPTTVGGGVSTTAPYSGINGGVVGPVTQGWLPGDPNGGPYSGTKLTSVSNADQGGGVNSTAFRLWCATDATRITDWGQLTNLGPALQVQNVTTTSGSPNISVTGTFPSTIAAGNAVSGAGISAGTTVSSVNNGAGTAILSASATSSGTPNLVFTTTSNLPEGQGSPIGVPIRLMGVNSSSGTEATFTSYAKSGASTGGCGSNMNTNAALDPNPVTKTGSNATAHIALENNSDQINQFAVGDFPSPDFVDQAIEAATTLYIESNGVFNTNPYAAATTINGTSYTGFKLSMNGISASTPNLLGNTYPTARTLFNIYRTATVRASTGGFMNWICDGGVNFAKGLDNSTGKNFDTELTTVIASNFGFPRLTDTSAAPAIAIPADNIAAPNNSCAAVFSLSTTSGSNQATLSAGGNFPANIPNAGGLVGGGSVGISSSAFPAGTTVSSGGGTATLTLSQNATSTGTVNAVFSGVPAVTAVANPLT